MSEPKSKMTLLLTAPERARLDSLRLARGDRSAAATLRALVRDAGGDPPRARIPSGAAMLTIAYDGLAAVVASVLRGYGLTPFCPPEDHARAEEADAAREQALERAGLVRDGEVTEAGKALVARAYVPPIEQTPRAAAPDPAPDAVCSEAEGRDAFLEAIHGAAAAPPMRRAPCAPQRPPPPSCSWSSPGASRARSRR